MDNKPKEDKLMVITLDKLSFRYAYFRNRRKS